MISDRDDRILEACLEELLGGAAPPDLSQSILSRATANNQRSPVAPIPLSDSAARPATTTRDASVGPSHAPVARVARPAWNRPMWLSAAVAAGLLVSIAGYSGYWSYRASRQAERAAKKMNIELHEETSKELKKFFEAHKRQRTPVTGDDHPAVAASSAIENPVPLSPMTSDEPKPYKPTPESIATTNTTPPTPGEAVAPSERPVRTTPRSSRTDEQIVAGINEQIRRRWQEEGIKPAAGATDAEWVRRVYLDVIGRIPSYEETNHYLADRGGNKKARLIDRLLESDECVEEYARNWTNIWSALLVGRSGGQQPGSLVDRDGLQQYLRRSLLKNKPYDRFVEELIAAEGSNSPGQPDFNGAVNFVLDNLQENGVSATAKAARLFLGMQVQCTQCHNHPFNDWKQDQFWELNAFFRQAKPVRHAGQTPYVQLVDADFAGEGGNSLEEAEVYWEMRNGLIKASYPAFVDGTRIHPSGAVSKVNRRDELARLVVQSEHMPRALVNRLWGHFLGYGFTKPVDDIGPHNPPSHPELLSQLAEDFAGRGFDVKSLIRWIALPEPYGLSSRRPAKSTDDPAADQAPLFSYFYLRQMRAEELYESLIVATGVRVPHETFEERERVKTSWLQQFTTPFGTEENDECTTFNGTISQTLAMWNGELVKKATSGERGSFLAQVAASDAKNPAKISQLFTAALSRKPTASELQLAQQLWQQRKGDTAAALQDLWWAVLNSNEFILNH
jgi:hypothetical protein